MRDASKEFRDSPSDITFVINITLDDGTALKLTNKDIFVGGIEIKDAVSSDSTFDIGACLCRQLTLRLNNDNDALSEYDFANAQISITAKKTINEVVESVALGKYIVDLPEFSGITVTLNCLDRMVMLNKKIDDISGTTAVAIVNNICKTFGISLATTRFTGWNTKITLSDTSDMTYIELLTYICQITCNYARINDAGKLEIKWYDTSVFDGVSLVDSGDFDTFQDDVIDGGDFTTYQTDNVYDAGSFECGDYHHLYSNQNESINTEDVVITGVTVKSDDAEATYGTEGYILLIENNPLVTGKEAEYAEQIGLRCVGMRFRPFSISTMSNLLIEAGDACIVTDRKGNSYYSYITSTTYKAGSWQSVSNNAEGAVLNSADTFSLVTKAVIKARKETKQQITAYDIAVQQLTELMANSLGVFKTAEEQENGSVIYYMHNRATLEESTTIWKMTSDAFAVSTDGGKTWNSGFDSSGNAVVNVLNAIGINADWINAGTLTGRAIDNGNGTFSVDENGNVIANKFKSSSAEITGGSINISTGTATNSLIKLLSSTNTGDYSASYSPSAFIVRRANSSVETLPNAYTSVGPHSIVIYNNDTSETVQIFPHMINAQSASITCKSLTQTSDARLKENRQEITDECKLLDLLDPVTFSFKADNTHKKHIGLYAQELFKTLKDMGLKDYSLVEKSNDGYLAINYTELIPLLIKDRNNARKELEEYKQTMNEMLEKINKRIEVLERGDY